MQDYHNRLEDSQEGAELLPVYSGICRDLLRAFAIADEDRNSVLNQKEFALLSLSLHRTGLITLSSHGLHRKNSLYDNVDSAAITSAFHAADGDGDGALLYEELVQHFVKATLT